MILLSNDYDIKIVGKQTYSEEDGIDPGEITLSTTGSYTERDGAAFISYKEYDERDPKITYTSVLKVEPGKLTMMRTGTATRLVLEQGKRHTCIYDTGFGALSVGVFTKSLRSSVSRAGGSLTVDYTLDIDSNLSSRNELEIWLRPGAEGKKM